MPETTVYGAKENNGFIELYMDGLEFKPGSFCYTDYTEIKTGKTRTTNGKIKKAKRIFAAYNDSTFIEDYE
ncbi:MAG: hypothetical protein M0Z43_13600 [Acidithiobacillus sp.]|nr:hypothetical protein [Acidithiobacillus sp.]